MPSKSETNRKPGIPVRSKAAIAFQQQRAQERAQECQAQIDAVIAEFGGETDQQAALARMAGELLYWRHCLRQLGDAVGMIKQGKPFIVMGPGPYWKPERARRWWC